MNRPVCNYQVLFFGFAFLIVFKQNLPSRNDPLEILYPSTMLGWELNLCFSLDIFRSLTVFL